MRISDWSSDVCSSDLCRRPPRRADRRRGAGAHRIAGGGMTRVFVSRDMASVALGADALARALSDMGCEVVRTGSRGLFSIEPLVEVETEDGRIGRSGEHTSELQSLMRISYAVFCLKKKQSNLYNTLLLYYTTP